MYISREKGDHYYIQTRHKDLFSHYNLILRKLYEKMSRKALENTNEIKCAQAPQYGRRIGKKVYYQITFRSRSTFQNLESTM